MKLIKYLFIPVLLTQFLFAQEVPGWVNTGNLADATLIKDFMQLPWSPNIVLACGGDRNGNYHAGLWKSKDKGLTWEYKFWTGEDYDYFTSIRLDSSKYRVWMVGRLDYKTIENSLYYSMDDGDTWTSINYPDAIDKVGGGYSIGIVNSHVYYGGIYDNNAQIKFYRYNSENSNPTNWNWEYITTFQNADGIPHIFTEGNYAYPCVRSNDHKIKIYKTNDESLSTNFISSVNLTYVYDFMKNRSDYFIAGDSNGIARIYKSPDMVHWKKVGEWKNDNESTYVESMLFYGDTLFISMHINNDNYTVYKSYDRGASWISCYSPPYVKTSYKLRLIDNEMWLATGYDYGDIFKATWNVQTGGDYFYGPTYVYDAKIHDKYMYYSTNYDNGELYKKSLTGGAFQIFTFSNASACYGISWDNDTLYVTFNKGSLVRKSKDNCSTWQSTFQPRGATEALALLMLSNKQLILGTDWYGDVYKSTMKYETGGNYVFGPTYVYSAKRYSSKIYFTTNYSNGEVYFLDGDNVSLWKNFSDASWATDLFFNGDTIFISMDSPNLIKKSIDGGNTWEDTFKPQGATHVLSILGLQNNKLLIGTDWYGDVYLGTKQYQIGGSYLYGPTYVYDADFCEATGYISTNDDNGEVWKTEDGGQNWSNLTKYYQPWKQVYSLVVFGNTIYAGTDYNGDVYKSEDAGQTWVVTGDLKDASDVLSLHLSSDVQRNKLFAGTDWKGDVFLSDQEVMTLEAPEIVLEPKFTQGTSNTVYCRNNGSDGYQFEIASDSVFDQIIKRSPVLTDTFYTFTNLNDGVTYYFRVYGRSCSYSSKASTKTYSTQDSKPPKIFAEFPSNHTWVNNNQPAILAHLKDDGIGVDTTKVTMMVDSILVKPQVTQSQAEYTPSASLSQGWHSVKVSAMDYFGQGSDFTWQFAVDLEKPTFPNQISPADSIILATQSVTFHWQASTDTLSGIKHYILEYSIDPKFEKGVDTVITVQTNYTVKLTDTTYYWRVTVYDSAGNSNSSDIWRVIVDANAPDIPVLHEPVKGVWLASSKVHFIWDAVSKQAETNTSRHSGENEKILSTAVRYVIQVSQDTTVVLNDTVSVNEYQAKLAEGKYYWQVMAFDEAQNESGWSPIDSFGVDLTSPVVDSVTVLKDTSNYFGPFPIYASVHDPIGEIDKTLLIYRFDSAPFDTIPMRYEDGIFQSSIPKTDSTKHQISYFVITKDKVGLKAVSDTIIFNILLTGINDVSTNIPKKFEIKNIWPNPTNGGLRIRFGLPGGTEVEISIFNILGQRLWSMKKNYLLGWHNVRLPADFPSGQYFIRIKSKFGEATVKGIIIK